MLQILARHRLQLPPNEAGGTPVTAAGETVSKRGPPTAHSKLSDGTAEGWCG